MTHKGWHVVKPQHNQNLINTLNIHFMWKTEQNYLSIIIKYSLTSPKNVIYRYFIVCYSTENLGSTEVGQGQKVDVDIPLKIDTDTGSQGIGVEIEKVVTVKKRREAKVGREKVMINQAKIKKEEVRVKKEVEEKTEGKVKKTEKEVEVKSAGAVKAKKGGEIEVETGRDDTVKVEAKVGTGNEITAEVGAERGSEVEVQFWERKWLLKKEWERSCCQQGREPIKSVSIL